MFTAIIEVGLLQSALLKELLGLIEVAPQGSTPICAHQEDNISGKSDAPSAFVLAALVQSAPVAYTQCTVQCYNSLL